MNKGFLGETYEDSDLVKCEVGALRTPTGMGIYSQVSNLHIDYDISWGRYNFYPSKEERESSFIKKFLFWGERKAKEVLYNSFKKSKNLEARQLKGVRNLWIPFHIGETTNKKQLGALDFDIQTLDKYGPVQEYLLRQEKNAFVRNIALLYNFVPEILKSLFPSEDLHLSLPDSNID